MPSSELAARRRTRAAGGPFEAGLARAAAMNKLDGARRLETVRGTLRFFSFGESEGSPAQQRAPSAEGGGEQERAMRTAKQPGALILANDAHGADAALSRVGGRTLLERHVDAFRAAGLRDIAVVRRAGVAAVASSPGNVKLVLPAEERANDFDALVLGLFALEPGPVIVQPVVNEVVSVETIALLASLVSHEEAVPGEARGEYGADRRDALLAVVPRHRGRPGHPVALTREGIERVVLDRASQEGLHDLESLLKAWGAGVGTVEVDDESVVTLTPSRPESATPRA